MYQHFYIIFPAGAGGNHLANIISTDERFIKRHTDLQYQNIMKRLHAHPISGDATNNDRNFYVESNKVFTSHLAPFLNNKNTLFHKSQKKIILIDTSSINANTESLPIKRMKSWILQFRAEHVLEEILLLYTNETVKKIITDIEILKDIEILNLDVLILFNESPDRLMQFLEKKCNIFVDKDLVNYMHNQWINMVKKSDLLV